MVISPPLSMPTNPFFLFPEASLTASEFTVSGFKPRRKRGIRPKADKGCRHNYPASRAAPYIYCKKRRFKPNKNQLPITVFMI
jgi:hypothetical protein